MAALYMGGDEVCSTASPESHSLFDDRWPSKMGNVCFVVMQTQIIKQRAIDQIRIAFAESLSPGAIHLVSWANLFVA